MILSEAEKSLRKIQEEERRRLGINEVEETSPEGWRKFFREGGTYETEFPVGRGIKEDIVYQSRYLHDDWEEFSKPSVVKIVIPKLK